MGKRIAKFYLMSVLVNIVFYFPVGMFLMWCVTETGEELVGWFSAIIAFLLLCRRINGRRNPYACFADFIFCRGSIQHITSFEFFQFGNFVFGAPYALHCLYFDKNRKQKG